MIIADTKCWSFTKGRNWMSVKPLEEYVAKRISMYAAAIDRNGNYTYGELISELYNMLKGTEPDFARELFRKAGVLL